MKPFPVARHTVAEFLANPDEIYAKMTGGTTVVLSSPTCENAMTLCAGFLGDYAEDDDEVIALKAEIERLKLCISDGVRWIPVAERHPDDKSWDGLLATDGENVFNAWWDDENFRQHDEGESHIPRVTHWMPYPEPPK